MKRQTIAYLDSLPEDVLSKILGGAMFNLANLPDRTPFETRCLEAAKTAYIRLTLPEMGGSKSQ